MFTILQVWNQNSDFCFVLIYNFLEWTNTEKHHVKCVSSFFFFLLDINYFHCLRILELLKVSESGSKNIFGYYSSQRMKVSSGQQCQKTLHNSELFIVILRIKKRRKIWSQFKNEVLYNKSDCYLYLGLPVTKLLLNPMCSTNTWLKWMVN